MDCSDLPRIAICRITRSDQTIFIQFTVVVIAVSSTSINMDTDTLFINQTEIYEAPQKLLTNFKKDGAERETVDYCKRKTDILHQYWTDHQENNRKLCENADYEHPYFTKQCFETAEEVYLGVKNLIENIIDQATKPRATTPNNPPTRTLKPNVPLSSDSSPGQRRNTALDPKPPQGQVEKEDERPKASNPTIFLSRDSSPRQRRNNS